MKRIVLLMFFALPALAQRSLQWESIVVKARLDDRGALHVSEEQTYLFHGDWNGGERTVRIGRDQRFEFRGIGRRDLTTGEVLPLNIGSLDSVDDYQLTDTLLRWRSRLPSDPPFNGERITYVIDYTLYNILIGKAGGHYQLDHDFAFPDRPGVIKRLVVDLDLDPAWHSESPSQHFEAGPLPPGQGFVVQQLLDFRGSGPPPEAQLDTQPIRVGIAALLLIVPVLLWQRLLSRETTLGRFEALNTAQITPQWIKENLTTIPAEVVGSAWDEDVGQHEVSALLARLVAEGKLKSGTKRGDLELELLVPRESFEGYERDLIDKLFIAGEKTSMSTLRTHYASSGFNPTSTISRPLQKRAGELAQLSDKPPRIAGLTAGIFTAALFFSAVFLLYTGWKEDDTRGPGVIVGAVVMLLFYLFGCALAFHWRGRIDQGHQEMKGFRTTIILAAAGALLIVATNFFSLRTQLGFAAFALMIASSVTNTAKSRRGAAAIAFRKRLASGRQYFIEQLAKSDPAIDDNWFPWIIAFGLDSQASAWATEFGSRARTTSSSSWSSSDSSGSSSSGSSPSSAPTWSGGGGAFGGAGATGTWAAAAGGMAAGIAAPSSSSGSGGSSSSGGGGSSSSSSGGGGGGGW